MPKTVNILQRKGRMETIVPVLMPMVSISGSRLTRHERCPKEQRPMMFMIMAIDPFVSKYQGNRSPFTRGQVLRDPTIEV
jgi:hypothetical protein